MKFLSKKNILLASLLGATILIFISFLSFSDLCRSSQSCVFVFVKYHIWDLANYILITPILLFFSLLTYWTNNVIFEAWKKFAVWAVPTVLVLTYLITRDTGGSGFFSMDFSLYYLAIIYGLFLLISLGIITITAIKKK